jgi:hypothetical protein
MQGFAARVPWPGGAAQPWRATEPAPRARPIRSQLARAPWNQKGGKCRAQAAASFGWSKRIDPTTL